MWATSQVHSTGEVPAESATSSVSLSIESPYCNLHLAQCLRSIPNKPSSTFIGRLQRKSYIQKDEVTRVETLLCIHTAMN
ncbi:hypothetical protein PR048_031979 [Dryococelus australis]|uniref:Uncharacterized protein n=1 Tax=Dryococelus australis TaxID=614101 RepID=A0ABQ9G6T4_9NEOP|nr:hypothetical protein PR048_031979 [Dryococelus australis]